MICHYIEDRKVGRVLIPCCMAVAVSGDTSDCTGYRTTRKEWEQRTMTLENEIRQLKNELKELKLLFIYADSTKI